ncbi:MAG: hypothetical protein NPIRA06_27400 [Nitrospirales bacterium]|nr:MAG: hypothetical protein NPIRA06_27400 [Nitrospirales bacterium]
MLQPDGGLFTKNIRVQILFFPVQPPNPTSPDTWFDLSLSQFNVAVPAHTDFERILSTKNK